MDKFINYVADNFLICLFTLILVLSGLMLWAIESGYGLYVVFTLMGLYALCGLGNILNNLQRDKYLRELQSPDVSEAENDKT